MSNPMTDKERAHLQLEHALSYLQSGWHLVMMAEGTKGPSMPGWNTPAELISTPEKAVARLSQSPQNMGLVHQPSGTCAIDVDDEAWTRFIWEQFGIDYDDVMGRGLRIWSKSNRDKVIFAAPDLPLIKVSWPLPNATKPTDLMTIFELRAGPNQDVLPPSLHPDGHNYQWWPGFAPWEKETVPQLPEQVLQFWRALADRDTGLREEVQNLCQWKQKHVGRTFATKARVSSKDHNDVVGKFNSANDVGDLLEQAGYKRRGKRYLAPSSSTVIPGVVVLDDKCYSHHGSDVLADGYAHDAFDLLVILQHGGDFQAALRDAAQQLGIDRTARPDPVPDMVIDLESVLAAQERRKNSAAVRVALTSDAGSIAPTGVKGNAPELSQEAAPPAPVKAVQESRITKMPEHLLRPPGVVGDMVQWILRTSQRPQPALAVGASIAMFGAVLGQKVATETGLRTNVYIVGTGGTSSGKDHARKAVKLMLNAAGMGDNLGGEEFGSGQGLLARVGRVPNTLFLPDEFGLLAQAVGNAKAASYEKAIMGNLMKLFSSAGSVYNGTEYANTRDRPRVDIPYPCVSLYATTTPETFYPALNSADVTSGWLNRMLIVSAPEARVPWQDSALDDPPERLVDWIKVARGMSVNLQGLNPEAPIVVPMASMAKTLFVQFRDWLERHEDELKSDSARAALTPLWGRAWEHAAKIGLVLGVARVSDSTALRDGVGSLEIDMSSAQWAIDFVKHTMLCAEHEVATRVGDSDLDRHCQEAMRGLRRAGVKGCTKFDLNRSSRPFRALEPRIQDMVLEMLLRREDAFRANYLSESGRGKPREAYVAVEFRAEAEELLAATTATPPQQGV